MLSSAVVLAPVVFLCQGSGASCTVRLAQDEDEDGEDVDAALLEDARAAGNPSETDLGILTLRVNYQHTEDFGLLRFL